MEGHENFLASNRVRFSAEFKTMVVGEVIDNKRNFAEVAVAFNLKYICSRGFRHYKPVITAVITRQGKRYYGRNYSVITNSILVITV